MSRERTYRTEAIVLRRKDIGEADRILTLFTPGLGKIRTVAKGIRKPRSRKAGHLELFTRSRLLLASGRDLDIITQAETVDAYRLLREDLLRGAFAGYMVELLDRFTPDGEENADLYDLLRQGLQWLCETPSPALAVRYYELHLLSLAGYQPQLQACIECGQPLLPEDQFFAPVEGGVVCPRCAEAARSQPHSERGAWLPLSLNALKVLRYIQANPYAKVAGLRLSPRVQAEVEYIVLRYITLILERQLKSAEFIKHLQRDLPAVPLGA